MEKTKILVTGGAGYIGSHMVRKLSSAGYLPVVIDNLVYGHKKALNKVIPFYKGNIGNRKILNKIFSKHNIKAVMHFSAYAYVGESVENPAKYYENNVSATLNLLETMIENKIKYFIFSSTCATYGDPQAAKITEKHPQTPINPYGQTKLIVEKILSDFDQAYGLKSMILRYFNAAGADDSALLGESHKPETHLIPLIMQNILGKRKEIKVFGNDYPTKDGTCVRDYIHVNDLAEAHLLALERLFKENPSDIFNLGTQHGYSVLEIIKTCERISNQKAKVIISDRRPGDPAILIADSTKAKKILNWEPKYDLEKIIRTAWVWEKQRKY
jgi:UDP-glucose 4-epimerase